jgi:uncharacterized protein YecT (DUF1311 family)
MGRRIALRRKNVSLDGWKSRLMIVAFAGAAGCAAAARISAQDTSSPEEKNWKAICAQAVTRPHTPPRFNKSQSEDQLQKCSAEALYYGFDGKTDPAAALPCAYYERSHASSDDDFFKGPGVLTMLYANGKAVHRDYNLAIRFACEIPQSAEGEMELRIGHLEQLRDTGATSKFDLCDDALSDQMLGACAFVSRKLADLKRKAQFDTLARGWSPEVKEAFKSLEKAEAELEEARALNEASHSGTAHGLLDQAERAKLRDQFLGNLKRFAKGDVPAATEADLEVVDHKLNAVYRQLEGLPRKRWKQSTTPPPVIRKTEQAWMKLRDAWIEFGRLAYPALSSTRIAAEITRLRLDRLESMARNDE